MRHLSALTVLLAVALLLPACQKESTPAPATEKEKAAPAAAKPAAPAVATPAPAARDVAAKQKAALQAMAKTVDPAKAPPEVKKMVEYMNGLTKAVADNMPDCQKAAAAAQAFADKNKANMEAISAKMKEMQKNPHSPQALEMSRYLMALMLPNMMKMQGTMKEFSTKCTKEAEQVGKLLSDVKATPPAK